MGPSVVIIGQQCQFEITKITAMVVPLKIETYTENWAILSLGQFSTWICCQPSYMAAISRNHNNSCYGSTNKDKDLQHKLTFPKYG